MAMLAGRPLRAAMFLLALLVAWQLATVLFQIPSFLVPSPIQVLARMAEIPDRLFANLLMTLGETLGGFSLAVLGGIGLAILLVHFRLLADCVFPLLLISQVIPMVAIAPILIIWFGSGYLSKVLVAFLISFFPMVVNTSVGLLRVNEDLMHLIRGLNASPWQIFVKIRLPNALPYIFTGMRVSISLSVIGSVVGEFVGASAGLGFLVFIGTNQLDTALTFSAITLLAAMGLSLYGLVVLLQRLLVPWAPGSGQLEP